MRSDRLGETLLPKRVALPVFASDALSSVAYAPDERTLLAEAIGNVFTEYVDRHGLEQIAEIFGRGVKVEVGDLLPSEQYADRLKRVPPAWEKAFEVNASSSPAMRASCVEFVLAGLHATERISRSQARGRIVYEIP